MTTPCANRCGDLLPVEGCRDTVPVSHECEGKRRVWRYEEKRFPAAVVCASGKAERVVFCSEECASEALSEKSGARPTRWRPATRGRRD